MFYTFAPIERPQRKTAVFDKGVVKMHDDDDDDGDDDDDDDDDDYYERLAKYRSCGNRF